MLIPSKRWQHFAAMMLIGDGVMAVIHPTRDARAWEAGPEVWKDLMRRLREHPELTRLVGLGQIAAPIWWALAQESSSEVKG